MAKPQIQILHTDMSQELKKDALQFASLALNLHEDHRDIARYIKKEFEQRRGGSWNCIVGDCGEYSTCVHYQRNSYIRFSVGDTKIVVFRSP
ncbi:hypothetical protein PO909_018844 [Leuciscus waleckii]